MVVCSLKMFLNLLIVCFAPVIMLAQEKNDQGQCEKCIRLEKFILQSERLHNSSMEFYADMGIQQAKAIEALEKKCVAEKIDNFEVKKLFDVIKQCNKMIVVKKNEVEVDEKSEVNRTDEQEIKSLKESISKYEEKIRKYSGIVRGFKNDKDIDLKFRENVTFFYESLIETYLEKKDSLKELQKNRLPSVGDKNNEQLKKEENVGAETKD